MNNTEKFKVLLVDNHKRSLDSIVKFFNRTYNQRAIIADADSYSAATSLLSAFTPDIAVLDKRLSDSGSDNCDLDTVALDGIDLAQEVWKRNPLAGIALSTASPAQEVIRALHMRAPAGAAFAYVSKAGDDDDLAESVEAILKGDCRIPVDDHWLSRRISRHGYATDPFTAHEIALLVVLSAGASISASCQILQITRRSIDVRLAALSCKLDSTEGVMVQNAIHTGVLNNNWLERLQQILVEEAEYQGVELNAKAPSST